MTEWWTYRLSDFRLFSARTYLRLFERYNHDVWPLHLAAIAIGVLIVVLTVRSRPRAAGPLLAAAWLFVAYAFHWKRYATIQTAAKWFAIAFVIEALLILARTRVATGFSPSIGIVIAIFGLVMQPLVTWFLTGRIEIFAITPDPTAVTTMGIALVRRDRALLAIPILWCATSGATLWLLHARDALVLPAVALITIVSSVIRAGD